MKGIRGNLAARIAPLLFVALGCFLVGYELDAARKAEASKSWPKTSGTLHVWTNAYRKELRYDYSVDSTALSSDRVIFGELGTRSRSKEWEEFGALPDGSRIEVFYMPGKPEVATLVAGRLCENSGSTAMFGLAFLLGGTAWWVLQRIVLRRLAAS